MEYGALGENWERVGGGYIWSSSIGCDLGPVGDYIRRDKDPLSIRGGNKAAAYNNRGNLYDKRGEIDNAIADYDQALRHNLKYIDAFMNRGVALYKKGEYEKPIADFSQTVRLSPKDAKAYYYRGSVHA